MLLAYVKLRYVQLLLTDCFCYVYSIVFVNELLILNWASCHLIKLKQRNTEVNEHVELING